MMNGRILGVTLVVVLAIGILAGPGRAADVTINVGPPDQSAPAVVQPSQPSVVVQPAQGAPAPIVAPGPPQVVVSAPPDTVLADDIQAQQVRAQTIYANKIKAREVRGVIHQTHGIKVTGKGDIKAPMLTASVIYADEIRADSVAANEIYVRTLSRD
jgi:hypothetical protein